MPNEFTPGPWNSKKWFADKNVLRIVDENDNTIAILYPGEDVKTNNEGYCGLAGKEGAE